MDRNRLLDACETLEILQWDIEDEIDKIELRMEDPFLSLKTYSQYQEDWSAYSLLWDSYSKVISDLETMIDFGADSDESLVPA